MFTARSSSSKTDDLKLVIRKSLHFESEYQIEQNIWQPLCATHSVLIRRFKCQDVLLTCALTNLAADSFLSRREKCPKMSSSISAAAAGLSQPRFATSLAALRVRSASCCHKDATWSRGRRPRWVDKVYREPQRKAVNRARDRDQ